MEGKCLACHMKLEKPYLFCSITCGCLAGYMSVRTDHPRKDIQELINKPELRKALLNAPPLRERPTDRNYL